MSIELDIFKIIDAVFKNTHNKCPYATRSSEVEVINDVVYFDEQPETCILDFYALPSQEKRPVVLYIHGGGFVAGGKEFRSGVSFWYASNGIAVVNVNYGLCPKFKFPEPLRHLVLALEWICKNAKEYNFDLDKLMVAGDSAGAYYASMLCITCNSKKLDKIAGVPDIKIKAAVLNCGVYDFDTAFKNKLPLSIDKKILADFTGYDYKNFEEYEYCDRVSPILFVDEHFPPTFVVYAKKDIFCKGQSEKLLAALQDSNVYTEHYCSCRLLANHCFSLNWKEKEAIAANTATMNFIQNFANGDIKAKHHKLKHAKSSALATE